MAGLNGHTPLAKAPEELTTTRLYRLGEGVGKVVYASDHWVVKRERSPSQVVAIIVLWKILRKMESILPGSWAKELMQRPSRQIRFLRIMVQASMLVVPKSIWFTTHIADMWRVYYKRDVRGSRLANTILTGTSLVPERVTFPPTRVRVKGWPGWLTVSEATERVESTLDQQLARLADQDRFDEIEEWLNRFLNLRQRGWQHGLFSLDAHLKNFGICGDHVVLLDTGGLTNRWPEIEKKLAGEEALPQPHVRLGLGPILASRPDIAERFDSQWRQVVNPAMVRHHWPSSSDTPVQTRSE
jgi:hypothetical protein